MKLTEFFLAQLEREAKGTRKALERVPEGKNEWKPHEKSMPLGYLAALVARMPGWIAMIVNNDDHDINPPGGSPYKPTAAATNAELLKSFEESMAEARAALENTNDERLMKTWRMLYGGHVVSETIRHVAISDAVFTHLAHHRGQLTVYLRLNDALVPAIYGPSADEGRL